MTKLKNKVYTRTIDDILQMEASPNDSFGRNLAMIKRYIEEARLLVSKEGVVIDNTLPIEYNISKMNEMANEAFRTDTIKGATIKRAITHLETALLLLNDVKDLDNEEVNALNKIKNNIGNQRKTLDKFDVRGRDLSIAITHIETAMLWLSKSNK